MNPANAGCMVYGLEELKRNLMRLANEATGEEVDRAIYGLGMEMAAKMRQLAHPSLRYIIVAKQFGQKSRPTISSAFVAIDRNVKDSRGLMMGRLAHLFEFGTYKTRPRKRKKLKGRGGGLAGLAKVLTGDYGSTGNMFERMGGTKRPFFRPVVDEYKGEKFLSRMVEIVQKRIERGR